MIITLHGAEALKLALYTNRQAEVWAPDNWRTANSHNEARRMLAVDPLTVRLRVGARVLVEDVLHEAVALTTDLATYLAIRLASATGEQAEVLRIIHTAVVAS